MRSCAKGSTVRRALGPLKTARSYRTVPLPEVVAVELAAHIGVYPSSDPDGLLLASRARRAWESATAAAGVPSLTFHGLRHFYASALIRAGHSPTAVAARLGNTAAMVLGTYAHLWPDDDDRTRDAVDDLFGSLRVPAAHLGG
jgi:integrase